MDSKQRLFHASDVVVLLPLFCLAVVLRLIKISQPFVDAWSWKQGTVAMIAENFYRDGFNIFYPQVNWAGSSAGYIGSEFPLVPFIAALLYVPFGVHEWIGRSVSVVFSVLSLPFFYLLVKKISNQRSAALATAIYTLVPLSVFAGRSFMSDMTSLSFSVVALYLFSRWLERSNDFALFVGASLATGLAILVKAPAIIIGVPLFYMAWEEHQARMMRRWELWLFAAFSLALPTLWYVHAYIVSISNPPYHFTGGDGLQIGDLPWYMSVVREVVTSGLTPMVAAGMLAGLFLPSHDKYGRMFHWWLGAICLFVLTAGYGNRHLWYQLPIVPAAAALSGMAFDFGLRKLAMLTRSKTAELFAGALVFAVLIAVCYVSIKPLYESWAMPLREAGHEIDRIAPPNALVIYVVDGDSAGIYYGRRKGWRAFDDGNWGGAPLDSEQAIKGLERLRQRGATLLVFTQYTVWWLDYYKEFGNYLNSRYRRLRETEDYLIFDLAGELMEREPTGVSPAAAPATEASSGLF
jgi:4-amino-4-deoxy-L-arabinose transferase-like glycosyltransferase